jgi:hypothetical protein
VSIPICKWTTEGISDDVSYLLPRIPSVYFGKRIFEAGKTNLLSRFEHGGQHAHILKNENKAVKGCSTDVSSSTG